MCSRKAEHGLHELVVADVDPSIPISIQLLERLAELLDDDASADEAVERDSRSGSTTDGGLGSCRDKGCVSTHTR